MNWVPTCYFDHGGKALCVILDRKALDAVRAANNPADESIEAVNGRELKEEIEDQRRIFAERHGSCTVRLIQRWYDGVPV